MENYLVSARKYRPSTFDSVVGQKSLTATLRNAIASKRLAHAYLFCGSRGVGKTSCARIFAKTINCENPTPDGNPCNECDSCRDFNEGRSLNIVELDAASNNGIDDMRAICDQVQIPPTNGRYRVFIFDEVHMLSSAAFNSFLKTLEEPPSYVIFILATTEKHKILPTILSRCQIYDFNRITISDTIDHLAYVAEQEGITAERSALGVIASKADGAMRDALSIFDQVAASSRGNITYKSTIENLNVLDANYFSRLLDAFLAGDVQSALLIYKEIRDHGFDSHFFINGLADYMRNLMVAQADATLSLLDVDDEMKKTMQQQAQRCKSEFFYAAMSMCNEADLNYRLASNKTFLVELLLIRLCQQQRPSQNSDGEGEGRLKPIAASNVPAQQPIQAQQQPTRQPVQSNHQPVVRPVTVTPPPPPEISLSAAPRQRHGIKRGPSLKDLEREPVVPQESAAAGSMTRRRRNSQYTVDKVMEAWASFMSARPKEVVLCNTMRACTPVHVEGDKYKIVVENPGQHEMMTNILTDLYPHMRNCLDNDYWELIIDENRGEGSPMTWNDREILNHMLEENAHVRQFVNAFKLSL